MRTSNPSLQKTDTRCKAPGIIFNLPPVSHIFPLSDRIDMSVDPFTGRNPSYCFVDFSSPELADLALVSLNGKTLLGRPVKVRPAVHKLDKQGNSYYGKRFAGRPHNAYDSLKGAVPTFDRWKRHDAAEHYDGYAEQGRRVYVGGLPRMAHQAAVDEEVRELFGAFKMCVYYL